MIAKSILSSGFPILDRLMELSATRGAGTGLHLVMIQEEFCNLMSLSAT
jgi:hypothetical protein